MGNVISLDAYRIRRGIEDNVIEFLGKLTCDELFERLAEREVYLAEEFAEVTLLLLKCDSPVMRSMLEKKQEKLLCLLQDYGPFEGCPCG